jgi:hypothetical protein
MKTNWVMVGIASLWLFTLTCPMKAMAQNAMPGGTDDTSVTNSTVVEAADMAVKLEEKAIRDRNDKPVVELSLVKIIRAQIQVVNGENIRLKLRVRLDKTEKDAETVVYRKTSGEYELISWEWK